MPGDRACRMWLLQLDLVQRGLAHDAAYVAVTWRRVKIDATIDAARPGLAPQGRSRSIPPSRGGGRWLGSLLRRRFARRRRARLDYVVELVVVDDLRPHGIDEVDHLLGHPVEEADHALAQGIDVEAEIVGRQGGRVDAHVAGEAGHRDVLDALRAQDFAQSGSAKPAGLAARRQNQIAILRRGLQRLVVGGFLRADLPGAAADLPAVEHARIGSIELAIVRGVALGDVHDENTFAPRLADELDDTVEHARLLVVFGELAVPGAVRRDEIGLEVDQQDGGLVRLDAFGNRRYRLRLRARNEGEQRENGCHDLQDMSHCLP